MNGDSLPYPFSRYGPGHDPKQTEPAQWPLVASFLRDNAGETFRIYIPVTERSFGDMGRYAELIPDFVRQGHLCGFGKFENDVVHVSYCIREGSNWGEIEYADWIRATISTEGDFIVPFHPTT